MHQITDLHGALRNVLNPDHEPMEGPKPVRLVHPAPAEASTDIGADDSRDTQADVIWPWLTLRRFLTAYIVAIAGALIGVHGYFFGWFA